MEDDAASQDIIFDKIQVLLLTKFNLSLTDLNTFETSLSIREQQIYQK